MKDPLQSPRPRPSCGSRVCSCCRRTPSVSACCFAKRGRRQEGLGLQRGPWAVFDPAEDGGRLGSTVSLSGTLSRASPCRWKDHVCILFSKFFHLALADVPTLRPFRDSLQTKLKHLLFSSKASLGAFLRRGPSPHAATAPERSRATGLEKHLRVHSEIACLFLPESPLETLQNQPWL